MLSEPGGRQTNEDYASFYLARGMGCYALADGLGGHRGGQVAAQTVIESVLSSFRAAPGVSFAYLDSYLRKAAQALDEIKLSKGGASSFKTTLVVLLTGAGQALWAHLGDSRLYHFRAGRISHQTKDHSVPQCLADSGSISHEMIRFHEDRHRLLASFESDNFNKVVYVKEELLLQPGDSFLLCSDGFWEHVLEEEMAADLKEAVSAENWLKKMTRRLEGRVSGNHDNYTALAVNF